MADFEDISKSEPPESSLAGSASTELAVFARNRSEEDFYRSTISG